DPSIPRAGAAPARAASNPANAPPRDATSCRRTGNAPDRAAATRAACRASPYAGHSAARDRASDAIAKRERSASPDCRRTRGRRRTHASRSTSRSARCAGARRSCRASRPSGRVSGSRSADAAACPTTSTPTSAHRQGTRGRSASQLRRKRGLQALVAGEQLAQVVTNVAPRPRELRDRLQRLAATPPRTAIRRRIVEREDVSARICHPLYLRRCVPHVIRRLDDLAVVEPQALACLRALIRMHAPAGELLVDLVRARREDHAQPEIEIALMEFPAPAADLLLHAAAEERGRLRDAQSHREDRLPTEARKLSAVEHLALGVDRLGIAVDEAAIGIRREMPCCRREGAGIVDVVGALDADELAPGHRKAFVHRVRRAAILLRDPAQLGRGREGLQDLDRLVLGSAVDDDDLERPMALREDRLQRLAQIPPLVVAGDDDREQWSVRGGHGEILSLRHSPAMYSDPLKLLFIHLPKTGGESIHEALKAYDLRGVKHRTYREFAAYHGQKKVDGYFVASFVRNPWDQVLSFYSHLRKPAYMKKEDISPH